MNDLSSMDEAEAFLHAVRSGRLPLRGRPPKVASRTSDFEEGFLLSFPEAENWPFARALTLLWRRWRGDLSPVAKDAGRRLGDILKREYDEGLSGDLAPSALRRYLHLRYVRDYLLMKKWLLERVDALARSGDEHGRSQAAVLSGNIASMVSRALQKGDVGYPAKAAAALARMISRLDMISERLAETEPEASRYLKKYRATILTRALHSGDLNYADRAAAKLPGALKRLEKGKDKEQRARMAATVYRIVTNGNFGRGSG